MSDGGKSEKRCIIKIRAWNQLIFWTDSRDWKNIYDVGRRTNNKSVKRTHWRQQENHWFSFICTCVCDRRTRERISTCFSLRLRHHLESTFNSTWNSNYLNDNDTDWRIKLANTSRSGQGRVLLVCHWMDSRRYRKEESIREKIDGWSRFSRLICIDKEGRMIFSEEKRTTWSILNIATSTSMNPNLFRFSCSDFTRR